MEKGGELTEAAIQKLRYHDKQHRLSLALENFRFRLSRNINGADEATRREENMKQAVALIDRELADLRWLQNRCAKREAAEEDARQAAAKLPSIEVREKMLHYETKLERQMYRAMSQLERLQRLRLGEAVPPPMTLEVSERS